MKLFKILPVTILLLLSSYFTFGQFNIQTGYDIGIIKFPKFPELLGEDISRKTNFNYLHRYNFIGEYKFSNNLVTSLNFGYDNYRNKFDYTVKQTSEGGCVERTNINEYYALVNTLRFDLSLGYALELSNKTSIVLKANYGLFIIANHKILKSSRIIIEENNCMNYIETKDNVMLDFINLNQKYGDGLKIGWNQVSISAEFRYKINHLSLNAYTAFSPMFDKEFIASTTGNSKNLIFILGLRLGYNLQSKNKENEN